MLTLTRSVGERIYIGDDIVIEVRAILDGRQVRISIDAPRQVPIHRAEIFEAVSRQNRSAALEDDASRFAALLHAAKPDARTPGPPPARGRPAAPPRPAGPPPRPPGPGARGAGPPP
ncbi:MAG TPA: carbon storage regulator, partial [Acidimicrobiales bacterium]|nr:carbon storage regulator [Acidimicrobiales bacterium]